MTPYGIVETPFFALDRDHKIDRAGNLVPGNAQHDRIQKGRAGKSIGEAIRHWYNLKEGDFEKIDFEVEIHPDGHFIIWPTAVSWRRGKRTIEIVKPPPHPLSFHGRDKSWIWQQQIDTIFQQHPEEAEWIRGEIGRVVADHRRTDERNLQEYDAVRAAGALSKLGMHFGPMRTSGYDCDPSSFSFVGYAPYPCPIELKKRSSGFKYQELRYKPLPRVVVLCMQHDRKNLLNHVDVIDLPTLYDHLAGAA